MELHAPYLGLKNLSEHRLCVSHVGSTGQSFYERSHTVCEDGAESPTMRSYVEHLKESNSIFNTLSFSALSGYSSCNVSDRPVQIKMSFYLFLEKKNYNLFKK